MVLNKSMTAQRSAGARKILIIARSGSCSRLWWS